MLPVPCAVLELVEGVPTQGPFEVEAELDIPLPRVAGDDPEFVPRAEFDCVRFDITLEIDPVLEIGEDWPLNPLVIEPDVEIPVIEDMIEKFPEFCCELELDCAVRDPEVEACSLGREVDDGNVNVADEVAKPDLPLPELLVTVWLPLVPLEICRVGDEFGGRTLELVLRAVEDTEEIVEPLLEFVLEVWEVGEIGRAHV